MSNGDMYSSPVPDRRRVHPSLDGTLYDNNVHKLVKSWTSNGLDNVWKIGAYFLIDTELNDGTPGIPTGSNIQVVLPHGWESLRGFNSRCWVRLTARR
jgi:hypothetical protein